MVYYVIKNSEGKYFNSYRAWERELRLAYFWATWAAAQNQIEKLCLEDTEIIKIELKKKEVRYVLKNEKSGYFREFCNGSPWVTMNKKCGCIFKTKKDAEIVRDFLGYWHKWTFTIEEN